VTRLASLPVNQHARRVVRLHVRPLARRAARDRAKLANRLMRQAVRPHARRVVKRLANLPVKLHASLLARLVAKRPARRAAKAASSRAVAGLVTPIANRNRVLVVSNGVIVGHAIPNPAMSIAERPHAMCAIMSRHRAGLVMLNRAVIFARRATRATDYALATSWATDERGNDVFAD